MRAHGGVSSHLIITLPLWAHDQETCEVEMEGGQRGVIESFVLYCARALPFMRCLP